MGKSMSPRAAMGAGWPVHVARVLVGGGEVACAPLSVCCVVLNLGFGLPPIAVTREVCMGVVERERCPAVSLALRAPVKLGSLLRRAPVKPGGFEL